MGQRQSQHQQPQSGTPSGGHQLPSYANGPRSKRSFGMSIGRGNRVYRSPVKYSSSVAVPTVVPGYRFGLESDEDENPGPAMFKREIIHVRSVEHLEEIYTGDAKELTSEEDITEPSAVAYENEIMMAYRKSRRISRLRSSDEYETDMYISRRERHARVKWESILSKQGRGKTSRGGKSHRDGGATLDMHIPAPDFLDPAESVFVVPTVVSDTDRLAVESMTAVSQVSQTRSNASVLGPSPTAEETDLESDLFAHGSPDDLQKIGSSAALDLSIDRSELVQLIDPYFCWAKCTGAFGKQEDRSVWAIVGQLLQDRRLSMNNDDKYLNVTSLLRLARQRDPRDHFQIVDYLNHLANVWGLERVADSYFDRRKAMVLYRPRMVMRAEELPSGQYTVSSFFSAVHLVVSRAMPHDRSLGEYIAIVNLLGKLIARVFENLSAVGVINMDHVSTSLALLACHVVDDGDGNDGPTLARAAVGFSLRGRRSKKQKSMDERHSNLPMLSKIDASPNTWKPANCAEPEALAHLEFMQAKLRTAARDSDMESEENGGKRTEIMCVSLTLKLEEHGDSHTSPMKGKPFCNSCSRLAKKLSAYHSCRVLDMAFLGN